MENFKDLNGEKLLLIEATPTKISNLENMPNLSWYKIFIELALKEALKDNKIRELILESDYVIIGQKGYISNWDLIKVTSINPLVYTQIPDCTFLRDIFSSPSKVLETPHIKIKFDNKYDIEKLFSEKYPEHYKDLDNRYEAIERGGNMVDFTSSGNVVYSFFDHKERSGYTKTICSIADLIK